MASSRGSAPNPADNTVIGTIDIGETWKDDIAMTLNGEPLTDVDDHVWTLTLYREPGASADLELSTADATLTVTEGASTLLSIRCASSRLSSLCGTYCIDVWSEDAGETIDGESRKILRARGTASVVRGAA